MFFLRYTFRLILGALLSFALFSPTFAAPPQLFVDNPRDHQINYQVLSGVIAVYGWALGTTASIARVEVSVDGETPMELGYGGERLDVAAAFPGAPEAATSGFSAALNTRMFTNGWHEFSVTAIDESGETASQMFMVLISNAPGEERPSSVTLDLSNATARIVQDKNAVLIENADINGQSITTPLLFDISSNQFSMISFVADADDDGVRDDDLNADGFADNDLNRDGFPDDDLDFNGLSDSQEQSGPFVSSGVSRGLSESPLLKYNETFAGLFIDTEIAVTFDEVTETFIGRVRNEAPQAVCDVQVAVTLDDDRTVNTTQSGRPLRISGLIPGGRRNFEFPVPGTTFDDWTVEIETFHCSRAPSGTAGGGESSEGSHEGGGEGGGEHGSGGEGGGEGSNEASPPTLISTPFSGVFQNQHFMFAFDASNSSFRGSVENRTNTLICRSRTEVHLGVGTRVVEMGPTIPENLDPGETLNVVMTIEGHEPETYALHPEASPCP
ncbi:MAG: hypothetical protein OXC18_23605 [Desulfurellaceae bacterium]|nr:hypothetical protein [Desulfurellaceae bacterium]